MRRISELIEDLQRVRELVGHDAEVEISVDISTGEEDAEARVFAAPIGVQMGDPVMILAEKIEQKKARKPRRRK